MTRKELFEFFQKKFQILAKERPQRLYMHPNGEIAWIVYEREEMLADVNRFRRQNGNAPLSEKEFILTCETPACGHVDYATKFPLYCAEQST